MDKKNFVQQRMSADCAVAALAMFLGRTYEDIARHCSGAELVSYGIGFHREQHICSLFEVKVDVFDSSVMNWNRAAILTVPSLNDPEGGTHALYWDGKRVWDPQSGREGKATYTNQRARRFALTGIQKIRN